MSVCIHEENFPKVPHGKMELHDIVFEFSKLFICKYLKTKIETGRYEHRTPVYPLSRLITDNVSSFSFSLFSLSLYFSDTLLY